MNLTLLRDYNFYVITKLFRFQKELCISYPSIDYVLDSVYISSEASNLVETDYGVEVLSVNLSSLRKINGVEVLGIISLLIGSPKPHCS
uniref:Putative ovule protein n=1 Tax=Solanum chacoense TaxID=4108 RepID=A0A0V0GVD5_SOLCH